METNLCIIDKIINSNAQNLPELRAFEAFEIVSKSTKFEVNSFSMDEIRVQYKDEEFGSVDLTEEDTIFTSHMRNGSSWFLRYHIISVFCFLIKIQ